MPDNHRCEYSPHPRFWLGSACTVNQSFKRVHVQSLCGVTHSSEQLPEEMGTAWDEQPQLNTVPNR